MSQTSPSTDFRSEARLILDCARHRSVLSVSSISNWDLVLAAASRHGVLPLLHRGLDDADSGVPRNVSNKLWAGYKSNADRNALALTELIGLERQFAAKAVPLIAFKGPVLAALAYQDLAVRQFADLDILVHREDLRNAARLLSARGYQSPSGFPEAIECGFFRTGEVVFQGKPLAVDLHWIVSPPEFPFAPSSDELFARARRVTLGNSGILTLSAEDTLLTLCVHGSKHGWSQLNWICDVAAVLKSESGIDWPRLFEIAGRLGSRRMLVLGLRIAHDLFDAPMPAPIWSEVAADEVAGRLAAQVRVGLFAGADGSPRASLTHTMHLKAMENWRTRIRYLRDRLRPTFEDWIFIPLPESLFLLYYVLRPVRFAWKQVADRVRHRARYEILASRDALR